MQFDPKLIHPDQPPLSEEVDIALPENLIVLGEQLRSDAVHLAAKYPSQPEGVGTLWREATLPANEANFRQRLPALSARVAVTVGAALAVSLAALLVAVSAMWIVQPATTLTTRNASPQRITAAGPPTVSAPVAAPAAAASATVSLGELSSPELEALLDLWQAEPGRSASVSF